jgi:glycosyltransferase involved in cell wall biosynthesis
MNVGLIIGRFPLDLIGGAELQAKQMAEQLARRGHQVVVFTRRYSGRPYLEAVDGYTICRRDELPFRSLRMVWDTFPAVWNMARYHPRPDVLLCYQTLNSGLIGMIAQALLGIPMVLSVRGNREYRLGNSTVQRRLLVPPIFSHAKCVIVQSARILDDMCEQFRLVGKVELARDLQAKTEIIPNGINRFSFRPSRGEHVIFVGRLIRNKGVVDLIEGMKQLPGAELLIVGDGPERDRLEALADELSVTFVGE